MENNNEIDEKLKNIFKEFYIYDEKRKSYKFNNFFIGMQFDKFISNKYLNNHAKDYTKKELYDAELKYIRLAINSFKEYSDKHMKYLQDRFEKIFSEKL